MNKLNNIFNQFITHTFVSRRFFYVWTYIVVIYILSFRFHFLFLVAHFHLLIMLLLTIIDYILVQFFENQGVVQHRETNCHHAARFDEMPSLHDF